MNTIANNSKLKAAIIGFAYAILSCGQVVADDTEIFFGQTAQSVNPVNPNVLFILDTSGSMSNEVGTTGHSRMWHMQEAMDQLLSSISNVNVGLMRFNNPGGPILHKVNDINAIVTEANIVSSRVSTGSDDAEQVGATMILDSNRLDIAYGSSGGSGSKSIRISNGDDDAEESASGGTVNKTSDDLDMESGKISGMRFRDTTIPQGADITSATITFRSRNDDTGDASLRFYGEDHDDAVDFDSSDPKITARTKTTAFIDWSPTAWSVDSTETTPDLSTIIEEIVGRAGWASDDLVIIQTHTSGTNRRARTRNNSSSKAPLLNVSWSTGVSSAQTIGLRFQEIGVPQNARITSAVIEFTGAASTSDAMDITIRGENVDNASTYTAVGSISTRPNTTASVSWTPDAWSDGAIKQTPSLTSIVQEIVNRPGWCGENAMAFKLTSSDAFKRVAYSYEGDTSKAPVLKVTYETDTITTATQGCRVNNLVYQINEDNNDAEETVSSGGMNLTSSDLDMLNSTLVGLRFTDVAVSPGADILEATLEFKANDSDTGSTVITYRGDKTANSTVFTSNANNISVGRPSTTATVSWSPPNFSNNSMYVTSDLSAIIEEIVSSANGWASGNALTLISSSSNSTDREADSHDTSPSNSARLRIKLQQTGPVTVTSKTVRNTLKELVSDFTADGWTPIVDTMYEAASYYRGGDVLYGKTRGQETTNGRISHIESYTGGTLVRDASCTSSNLNSSACANEHIDGSPTYITPIVDACQTSYIVLLTDGAANNNNSEDLIRTMRSNNSCVSTGGDDEECGRELANFLANTDQSKAGVGQNIDGDQNVVTHTVAFNLESASAVQFLQDIATNGNGQFKEASTATELLSVFENLVGDILNIDTSFVAAGATVNQFNRLTHQNDIYFSLFKPNDSPHWSGNLKKYKITGSPSKVTDSNNVAAVDATNGFFLAGSKSFWSDVTDGNEVAKGGAAGEASLTRNIYTYTGDYSSMPINLTDSGNALSENNTALTLAMMGIDDGSHDATYLSNLLKWSRGVDVKDYDKDTILTEVRSEMGAPLHSQPVIVTYGGNASTPDNTIFVNTNEGYLHAVDADDGTEHFAFVPKELLANLDNYYVDSTSTTLPYGLDGSIVPFVKDVDGDNQIESVDGDHVYIYIGMRRGGRNYYAIDATDRTSPKLLWKIFGGSGDFAELGQTWSKPILTKVKIGSTVKEVLIFAGGYDEEQDGHTVRTVDDQGRAIFIVDAATGALLWSGGPDVSHDEVFADMTYSIPSDLSIIDINSDNLADQIYVGDMGGQVWRFDIANGSAVADLVTGGVIADLADTTTADNRRFYFAPDIALLTDESEKYYSINIGSGFRAHPLNEDITDRFYAIKDYDVYTKPSSYTKLTESNLYDATANTIGEGDDTDKATALSSLGSKSGWRITLENSGEKVLAESTTVNNQVLFTTYQPNVSNGTSCGASLGKGRLYAVSAFDATPVLNLDGTGDDNAKTKSDRAKALKHSGIPSTPTVLFPDGADPVVLVGPETPVPDLDFGSLVVRTYWYEVIE